MDIERSKFNVSPDKSKRTYNGIVFDSAHEMWFYRDWILPKMDSGDIVGCELQKKYELQEKFMRNGKTVFPITYLADFVVTFKDGHTTVYDVKGVPDAVAIVKQKLFWHRYPDVDYQWISYSVIDSENGDCWVSYEKVKKGRHERKIAKNLAHKKMEEESKNGKYGKEDQRQ